MANALNTGSALGTQSAPEVRAPADGRGLVSRRAYAAMCGVTEKAVRKAIATGKISTVDGRIDPVIADADWARNRDAGQQSKMAAAAALRATGSAALPPPADALGSPVNAPEAKQQPEFDLAPLTEARIKNTESSTALKEITRRKLEGGLLEAEEVERTWGELLQMLKDRLRLLPDEIAPSLASCTDEAECRSILTREILLALGSLSDGARGMVAA